MTAWWEILQTGLCLATFAAGGYGLSVRLGSGLASGGRIAAVAILGAAVVLLLLNVSYEPFVLAYSAAFAVGFGVPSTSERRASTWVASALLLLAALWASMAFSPWFAVVAPTAAIALVMLVQLVAAALLGFPRAAAASPEESDAEPSQR